MQFIFDYIHELEPMSLSKVQFAHEPTNELVQYHLDGVNLQNRMSLVPFGDYEDLELEEEPPRFTKQEVSKFGIKSTVGIGAFGYYMDIDGKYGVVKVPINYQEGWSSPYLEISETDKTITYLINNPDVIVYETFRLIFRQGDFAYEFITTQMTGEVEKPFGMQGDFMVTCIGYRYEIQEFSQPTEPIAVSITQRSDDFPITPPGIPENRLIPPGGAMNQSLVKEDDSNFKVKWQTLAIPDPPRPTLSSISASNSFGAEYTVEKAIDNNPDTYWASSNGITTGWIRLGYENEWKALSYSITGRNDVTDGNPQSFQLVGIKGLERTILDSQSGITWDLGQTQEFYFSNDNYYSEYELNITMNGGRPNTVAVAEITLNK